MSRKPLEPIRQASQREHEKPLTQTICIASGDRVPACYHRFRLKSPAIYAKVQVLSSKKGLPVFVETDDGDRSERTAYWVHEDVLPELTRWLRVRIFPIHEVLDRDV